MAWTDQIALRGSVVAHRAMTITFLVWSFLALLCVSLVLVSRDVEAAYHISFDSRGVVLAGLSVAALGLCVPLLVSSRSPLGFAASFYLMTITAGYLWLSYFTPLEYDRIAARFSVVASWAAFALPALFISALPPTRGAINAHQMDLVCGVLILLSASIAVYGYSTGFHLVGFVTAQEMRETIQSPTWMRYAVGIVTSAALPFSYAWFFTQKRYVIAAAVLVLLMAFYPITLNKTALLTPFWLGFLTVLLKLTSWRKAVVLSLLLPAVIGLAAKAVDPDAFSYAFRMINFRMLAIPASAIDHYNHFFSTHPLTNFCQISIVGRLFDCILPDHLGVTLANQYATGNYNASLLATEGIASVGAYLAPISALLCGLVIAVGNTASRRLDPAFVLLSGAVLLQAIMNVPLSTIMLTHGGILLFVLWLITPRRHDKP